PRDPVAAAATFERFQRRIDSSLAGWRITTPWMERWRSEILDGSNLPGDTAGFTFRVQGGLP
ncbi:MAG TPA: hypothetical protein PKO15_12195, partial [Fibrobacteria bacterium]|nr:hypothetical protein [Fibrobacteria bacterium]